MTECVDFTLLAELEIPLRNQRESGLLPVATPSSYLPLKPLDSYPMYDASQSCTVLSVCFAAVALVILTTIIIANIAHG